MPESRTTTALRLGYGRVSTTDQNEDVQRDARTGAGCDRLFVDHASGKTESRPGLGALLEQVRPGDTVDVWRLDRLGATSSTSPTSPTSKALR